ncbi:vapb protein (antitoxin to vapc) [hydrocarbon metagenome]|uniref:Vapb protein (Antitoxin to vapc) n=1 Tax=hydrocarbon metagenome TaxID=938273 RepID=A0A0W8G033_9ZZZZ
MEKTKIFKSGNSQAIRLPKKYRILGDEVFIKKMGDGLLILPQNSAWSSFVDSLNRFSSDFMNARFQPPVDEREELQ